jgi:hypothetical protein
MKKNLGVIIGALVVGLVLGYLLNSGNAGSVLNKDTVLKTINEKLVSTEVKAELKGVTEIGNLSELTLDFAGQEDKLYTTDDGKMFFQKIYDQEEVEKAEKAAEEARAIKNKSDKPEVELFVMSYCPYGTQMEKGYIPAIRALGDKINSKVKFVNYVMHGEKEATENVLQYCVQENMPEKFDAYLECFLDKGEGNSDSCLEKSGVSKNDIKACISNTTKEFKVKEDLNNKDTYLSGRYPLFKIHDGLNKKYGVQGSPSIVINGQKIDGVGRDAQSILNVICSAFNEKPEECNTNLSSDAPAPGFGYDSAPAGNTSAGGCGA